MKKRSGPIPSPQISVFPFVGLGFRVVFLGFPAQCGVLLIQRLLGGEGRAPQGRIGQSGPKSEKRTFLS